MNWLLILVVVLLIVNVLWGYKKGCMRVVFSLVSWILVLGLCYFGTPMLSDALIEKTDIEVVIQEKLMAAIGDHGNLENVELQGLMNEWIEKNVIPQELIDVLAEKGVILQGAEGNSVIAAEEIVSLVISYAITGIVYVIIVLICSIVVAVAARFVTSVADMILGFASKLPLIGPLDKLLGLALGAVKGLIWCWFVLTVVAMLTLTGTNTELIVMVQKSSILTWLYDNNIIVNMLLKSI